MSDICFHTLPSIDLPPMIRILRAGILLFFVLLASSGSAQPWSRLEGREVEVLRIEGLGSALTTELRRGLALTPRSRLLGRSRATLRARTVEADRSRALLWLARNGYPDATVEVGVEPDGERVRVVLRVQPGERVRVGDVRIEGLDAPLQTRVLPALASLRSGVPFRDSLVEQARSALQAELYGAGYARAEVHKQVNLRAEGRADVVYTVDLGSRFRFGAVEVEGVADDLDALAHRVVRSPRGERFRPAVLTEARNDLRDLGLFRQVNVSAVPFDSTTLTLQASLSSRPMRTLEASVGTWSDYPVQVRARWRHRNLLQRGRGLSVGGAYALRRQEANVALGWPALLSRRSSTEWSAGLEIEDEEAYRLTSGVLRWSNLFRVGRHVSWRVGVALFETSLDLRLARTELFDVEPGRQFVFEGQWYYDGVDDPLDPTRGWRVSLESSWAPVIAITDAPFLSGRIAVSRVQPLLAGITWASRLDLARAKPLGEAEDLLPSQRWFAGGFNTMRGASRRGLGPADGKDPLGGEVRVLAGTEVRLPLRGIFGLTLFLDTGQVWAEPDRVAMASLASAVGGGLLVRTPIGPIHLEVARNIGRLPIDDVRTRIQFGIGHPF